MLRSVLTLCVSCCLLYGCSSMKKLEGNYFSKQQDCFAISETESSLENFENGFIDHLFARQRGKKLSFSNVKKRSPFQRNVRAYNFKIIVNNDDSIIVTPRSELSRKFFNNRDTIVLRSKHAFIDRSLAFDKIIFHSNGCGWYCPFTSLQLDNSGKFNFTFNGDGVMDTSKNRNFIGNLNPEELERLKKIIQYSQLRTIRWPAHWRLADYPSITLIFYHNGSKMSFNGMGIPIAMGELIRYLIQLSKHKSLSPTKETFEYER